MANISLDQKDKLYWKPSPCIIDLPAETVTLSPSRGAHTDSGITRYSLNGEWELAHGGEHIPRLCNPGPDAIKAPVPGTVHTALFEAGARRTQMMERPIAAAIGAGLAIGEAYGELICDIGGGVANIAVLSLGRIVVRDTVKIGGDAFDDAIIRYIRRKHNLLIGPLTAEDLKINIGSALPRNEQFYMEVTGRNLLTGLPRVMRITSDEITEAMDEPLHALLEAIHSVLEHTPAELVADIFISGITLSGGGALLTGLCEAVAMSLKVKCKVAEDPQVCVAKGCGMTLENMSEYGQFLGDKKKR